MKLGTWLQSNSLKLEQVGIATARLDALVLLEDCIGKDRGWLLAHPDDVLSTTQMGRLTKQIKRRRGHEPLAYIRRKTQFYGRDFYIDHRVLEPRPESETLIELLKALNLPDGSRVVDLGTGSGALAVTAKLELPKIKVFAIDVDPHCLEVAKRNAHYYMTKISFFEGNLLQPLKTNEQHLATIIANLPYVPENFQINPAASHEPKIAIYGGKDGLQVYRQLFKYLKGYDFGPQFILTESLPPQHSALATIAKSAQYKLIKTDDFIQVFAKN